MNICVERLFQKKAKVPSSHKSKILKCCHYTLKESPSFCLIADIKLLCLFFLSASWLANGKRSATIEGSFTHPMLLTVF